ncbi:hypothetical protein D8Y22_11555 [Salinadaptatus halalkaliphilus]|uniref:LppX_LprAFG lipoprotein n=1 Tax=Salinadaptatus halalkaliphilus TaxID=2419781 RepID=A0A4S3TKS8_9EURY|nr:hypothetical protein D8Y22_11555 [Salinadaptatus halalkaliphilus]
MGGVVVCLLVAGCTGVSTPLTEESTDQRIDPDELTATASDVETYELEVTRTLQSSAVNETTTIDGVVDRSEQRAKLTRTVETNVGTDQRRTTTDQYVIDGTQYTTDGNEWQQTPLNAWNDIDRLENEVTMLEGTEPADFERIRTQSIGDIETTMYEVTLGEDVEADRFEGDGGGHVPLSVEEYVYYVLVDTETDTLYGTDLRMEVNQGGNPAVITIETIVSDTDEPVDITLPEDPTDA